MSDPIPTYTLKGVPGPLVDRSGIPPVLTGAVKVPDFTPPDRFQPPTDKFLRQLEIADGTYKLYGTPLTHRTQQELAYEYALSQMGFSDEPVSFYCNFSIGRRKFTADRSGWLEKEVS